MYCEQRRRIEGGREKISKMISICKWPKPQDLSYLCVESSLTSGVGLTCPGDRLSSVGLAGVLGHEFLCFASRLVVVLQYPFGLPVGGLELKGRKTRWVKQNAGIKGEETRIVMICKEKLHFGVVIRPVLDSVNTSLLT